MTTGHELSVESPWCRSPSELLTIADDAVVITDATGVICFCTQAAAAIFGHNRQHAASTSLDLIIPEPQRARHWDGFHRATAAGTTRSARRVLAVSALRADGMRISVEFTVALLRDDRGDVQGVGAILRDVAARWEEQRALRQRLRELEHELAALRG